MKTKGEIKEFIREFFRKQPQIFEYDEVLDILKRKRKSYIITNNQRQKFQDRLCEFLMEDGK